MQITLEKNQRFGKGFQIRIQHGPMDKVYDGEELDLYTAGAYAGTLLEEINRETGSEYKTDQVVQVTEEGLTANARTDFAAARFLQDIQSGSFELSTPAACDYMTKTIDGKEEMCFTARGTVLFTYFAWADDHNMKARAALERYCQYIAAHGYQGGASKALADLDALDKDGAVAWIRRTHARHVKDDAALIQYMLGV